MEDFTNLMIPRWRLDGCFITLGLASDPGFVPGFIS